MMYDDVYDVLLLQGYGKESSCVFKTSIPTINKLTALLTAVFEKITSNSSRGIEKGGCEKNRSQWLPNLFHSFSKI